ncbi:MAG: hypothetical protein WC626_12430 [Methanoregula sp.]
MISTHTKWELYNMSSKNKKKIVLIRAKSENAIKFFSTKTSNELDYWVYLGKNVILFSDIEKVIGGRIKKIDNGENLQDAARTLRNPYIDFVGSIAQKENKNAWILTSVSEKNAYESDLFLMLCYLEMLDQIIKKYPGNICVFCEEPALIHTIRKNFENHTDLEIYEVEPLSKIFPQLIRENFKFIYNKASFFRYFFLRIFYARVLHIRKISGQNILTNKPVIAIHSWTDQRSFLIDGSFSDAYYGNLGQLLEKNKNNSFYMIDVLGTISYLEALKKLSKLNFQWILFEDFLEFSDIIRAWHLAQRRKTEETIDIFFLGHEISDLLNEEYARDRYSNRAEQCALYYFAARRMARQFSVKTFIYTFENHIWEKMTIEGIRESSPHTKIVGYAHTRVDKMYLCYSLSLHEKNLIPIPDVILVNGPQVKKILLESGFEDTDIQIIGSLRYGNLKIINKRQKSERKSEILVVLSGDLDRSLEMIFKCVNAFSGTKGLSITFKPHPVMNPESMIKPAENLPKIFCFSSKPISTLFETTNLVIYSDSTASVEAASLGIPLLHIKSDFSIDMNIFEDVKLIPSVSSPQQIRIQSLKILDGEYPSFEEIQMYVKQIFSRVDEQKIMEIIC